MEDARGPQAVGQLLELFLAGFPDLEVSIEELLDMEGGRVVGRFISRGTHTGEFMGIAPTGRTIEVNGIGMYTFSDGKVAREWVMDDLLGLLQQLGAVPSAA
ncbi:ester cyclase [Streptomyces blattellae]|uniref:ester cyclase n=1 Tax=Streptomyces blattellae TaxID=2569855 RepID=UPI0018ACDFBC|nr:ester cyclase [Streptomyces blattellae]